MGVVGRPQHLETDTRGGVPYLDGRVPRTAGQPPAIRAPSDPKHQSAMSPQHTGRGSTGRIKVRHQLIRATADQLCATGTPVNVKEGSHVAPQDADAPR